MKKARFSVTYHLLASLLGLPEDASILYVLQGIRDIQHDRFDIIVTHPDLPEVLEGMCSPECCPTFTDDGLEDWNVMP